MKNKKKSRIPEFKNYEEEANFWDTHSFADYWDELEDVDIVVNLQKSKEKMLMEKIQSAST